MSHELAEIEWKGMPEFVQEKQEPFAWKFNRWHHQVDYRPFKNNLLIKGEGLEISDTINDYGMKLIERSKHETNNV